MKVVCQGCGRVYERAALESFECSCGTKVDASFTGKPALTSGDVPAAIREFFGGAKVDNNDAEFMSRNFSLRFEACLHGAKVIGCNADLTEIIVPPVWKNKPVVEIGDYAFRGKDVQMVFLPESITAIGIAAFENCFLLRRVECCAEFLHIEGGAFRNCVRLKEIQFHGQPDAAIDSFAGCYQLGAANERVHYRRRKEE